MTAAAWATQVPATLGNIVGEPTPQGQRQFSYLADGHIRSISDSSGTNATFKYDPFGNVQELHLANSSTVVTDERNDRHYGDLLEWRDEDGASAVLSRSIPGFDGRVATRRGAGGHWLFTFGEDRGTRFVTDEDGNFVQDMDYLPYGAPHVTGAQPGSDSYTKEQWNGGDALAAFGISQLGERLYDPAIGRFLSRDPLLIPELGASANSYAFALNDPINVSDPTGLCGRENEPACYLPSPPIPGLRELTDLADNVIGDIDGLLGGSKPPPPADFSHSFSAPPSQLPISRRTCGRGACCGSASCGQLPVPPGPPNIIERYIDDLSDFESRGVGTAVAGIDNIYGIPNAGVQYAVYQSVYPSIHTATSIAVNGTVALGTAAVGGGLGAIDEAIDAATVVDGVDEANIVYRGLAAGENPATGLVARNPAATNSIASHVAGQRASQWISTTRSLNIAMTRFGQNGIAAIDLSKVGNLVVDLTQGIPGIGRSTMLSRWAINAQEVVIQGGVPAEAIVPFP